MIEEDPTLDIAQFVARFTVPDGVRFVPELQLRQADGVIELWDRVRTALQSETIAPPFWAFAWAGGQALARYVLDNPALVRGRRVLDFACGSGLVGIAAARAGAATVRCVDIDRFALEAVRANAALNDVNVEAACVDLLGETEIDADVVLAGDVFYERALSDRVLPWLHALAARGVEVLAGDPDRNYPPADGFARVAQYVVPVSTDLEGRSERSATVWRALRVPPGQPLNATSG